MGNPDDKTSCIGERPVTPSHYVGGMDNAEGSSRSIVDLSAEQQDVLVGTLLGDGCLARHGRYHRLHVKHKAEHESLVRFKREVFRNFVSMDLHRFGERLGDQTYACVQFASRTSPAFSEWHAHFYRDRRKIVPANIVELLSPETLAVWLMDDGAADYAGLTFQTHGFVVEEVELLAKAMRERYGLAVNSRRNRQRWIIYVTARSMASLEALVMPYLLDEFRYKLQPRRARTP